MQEKKAEAGSSSESEERKRKRMISNRESARRSRMRKQKLLQDMATEIGALQRGNRQMRDSIDAASQSFMEMEAANNVLRARAMELADRLRSLSPVLQIAEAVGELDVDTPNAIDEPWMQLCRTPSLPTV